MSVTNVKKKDYFKKYFCFSQIHNKQAKRNVKFNSVFTLKYLNDLSKCIKHAIFPPLEFVTHYFLRQILAMKESKARKTSNNS